MSDDNVPDFDEYPIGDYDRAEIKHEKLLKELRELVEEWREKPVEPYGMTWRPPAEELKQLIEEHTDE